LALGCRDIRLIANNTVHLHFSYDKIDQTLGKRSLSQFIKAWDPGKVYFLDSDIQRFENEYALKIADKIQAADCKFIDDIANTFNERYKERQPGIKAAIAAKHDFTIDEYLTIDAKTIEWAKTPEELTERWRKRIKFQALSLKGSVEDSKVPAKLKKRFELAEKRQRETKLDDIYTMYLNAFSTSLDPHTEYFPPVNLEEFRIQTRLSLEGIGAVLRSEDGFTKILSMVPGGAAAKTGKIKAGDTIIAVAQGAAAPVDVIDMDLKDVVNLVRGKRGSEVRLSIMRESKTGNEKLIVPIIREKVDLEDRAAKSWVYEVKPKDGKVLKIGVLSLPSFYMDFQGRQSGKDDFRSSSRDMLREIDALTKQGVDSLVLDLRNNGGGSLDESIKIAGIFIEKGPIVQIKAAGDRSMSQDDTDPNVYYKGPLVVMINLQSASASEIFAGAIKDYQRGVIVGDSHTFGKGTVQNLNDLDAQMGAIKVTISKFYRPSGSSTQVKGVDSDIALPSMWEELEIGEKSYEYALPWQKIDAVKYAKLNLVDPYLQSLTDASQKRIAKSEEFLKLKKSIDEYKQNSKLRTQVSLKEDKAKEKERKELEAEEADDASSNMSSQRPDLYKDVSLNEGIQIAADYARLISKESLADLDVPDYSKAKLAAKAAEASRSKEALVKEKPAKDEKKK
jgi:carboxyl-terminal processing protease